MPDIKISQLDPAASAAGAMEFEVNDGGNSRKVTGNQIDNLVLGTTTGLVARTGTNARAARTLTAGNGITVSNGNGVSGNPTVAINPATQAQAEAGTDNTRPMTPLRTAQAIAAAADGLGYDQTWQTVSRSLSTSYRNTTGKPIVVSVQGYGNYVFVSVEVSANNSTWVRADIGMSAGTNAANSITGATAVVPDQHYYRFVEGSTTGTVTITGYSELR